MTKRPHSYTYIWRGLTYSLTSISALFAGYLIQDKPIFWLDFLILLIPSITSIFFFMCYAECFPSVELQNSEAEMAVRDDAIWVYSGFAFLLMILISVCAFFLGFPFQNHLWLIPALLLLIFMHVFYGIFLWRNPATESVPIIRHQLVWSVILSIGFSLYFGLNYSNLSTSPVPLAPLILIALLYLATQNLSKRKFLFATISAFLISTVLAMLMKTEWLLGQYFFSMLFCIIVSAYLAVFESWKITSDISKKEKTGSNSAGNLEKVAASYSMATLAALMGSVWALPFFFVFSQYGTVFIVFFGVHAFVSFLLWNYLGHGKHLKERNWGVYKVVAGIAFLLMLVLITFYNPLPNNHFLKNFVSWSGLSVLIAIGIFIVPQLFIKMRDERFLKVFEDRINFTRALSVLIIAACFFLLIVLETYNENSVIYFKGELAFIFYSICFLLCGIAELINYFSKPNSMTGILSQIFGLILLMRIITSSLIAMAVFLPSVYTGRNLGESIFSSIPFFFSAIGGFALNDYFDAKKDLINKPYRAIPSGRLSRNFVLLLSIFLLFLALLTARIFAHDKTEFILYLCCISGVASYNLFVKHLSLSKTFLTATISSLPILFSVIIYDYPKVYLLLPIATCSFILGREWLMDIRDLKGDSSECTKTIPMIIGQVAAAKFGFSFLSLGALLLLPIVIFNQSYWSVSLFIVVLLSVIFSIPLWIYHAGLFQRRVIQILWFPMLCGLLLFIN